MDINDKRNQSGGFIPRGTQEDTQILTARGDVHKVMDRVVPRSAIYVTAQDVINFQVTSLLNNLQMLNTWRMMLPNGQIVRFEDRPTYTAAGSGQAFNYHLDEGWLLMANSTTLTTGVPEGSAYVQIAIGTPSSSGLINQLALANGTFQSFEGPSWPWPYTPSTNGPGWRKPFGVGNPAAGSEWSFAFNQSTRQRVETVMFTLATSATVANRNVRIRQDVGGSTNAIFPSGFVQAASLTVTYIFGKGLGFSSADATLIEAPLPLDLDNNINVTLEHISSLTNNLQAGDQYSNIVLYTRQWHESD